MNLEVKSQLQLITISNWIQIGQVIDITVEKEEVLTLKILVANPLNSYLHKSKFVYGEEMSLRVTFVENGDQLTKIVVFQNEEQEVVSLPRGFSFSLRDLKVQLSSQANQVGAFEIYSLTVFSSVLPFVFQTDDCLVSLGNSCHSCLKGVRSNFHCQ